VNVVLEKKNLKNRKYEKTSFHVSALGNGLNKIQFGIIESMTTYGT
jgi:hypothetical protein